MMEVTFRPLMQNNLENWQTFHDDAQIVRFLNNLQKISNYGVNWIGKDIYPSNIKQWEEYYYLTSLVPLEQLFDKHDKYKKTKEVNKPSDVIKLVWDKKQFQG